MAIEDIKNGDKVIIDGLLGKLPNPSRKWWQFWRPKQIKLDANTLFALVSKT